MKRLTGSFALALAVASLIHIATTRPLDAQAGGQNAKRPAVAGPAISLSPRSVTALLPDGFTGTPHPVQFTAAPAGASGAQTLRWDVNGIVGGDTTVGTISQSGLYTPPAILPNPPHVIVHALATNGTGSGSAEVALDRNVRWTSTNADRTGPCDFAAMLANQGTDADCHYKLASDGIERDVRIRVGRGYAAGNAAVIFFHGSGNGYAPDVCTRARTGNWMAMADRKSIVVVCPHGIAGTKQGWDAWWTPSKPSVDDAGFVWALLKDVETRLGVSPKKRYLTGISAGGNVMSRLAIEDGALVAAIAPIEGSMSQWDDKDTDCAAKPREGGSCAGRLLPPMPYPVSSLHIKGTVNVNSLHPFCSTNAHSGTLQEDFDYASTQIKAGPPLPNANSLCPAGRGGKEGAETHKKAVNATTGAVVQVYVIQNGMHQWYPADLSPAVCPPADVATPYNCQLRIDFPQVTDRSEAEYVWAFFAAHPQK
jgi:poly(3-hydroxybutyrate) depolymerase